MIEQASEEASERACSRITDPHVTVALAAMDVPLHRQQLLMKRHRIIQLQSTIDRVQLRQAALRSSHIPALLPYIRRSIANDSSCSTTATQVTSPSVYTLPSPCPRHNEITLSPIFQLQQPWQSSNSCGSHRAIGLFPARSARAVGAMCGCRNVNPEHGTLDAGN